MIAVDLLKQMISIPSFSKEESGTADLLTDYLEKQGCRVKRKGNNIWTSSAEDPGKPNILINSHHDTVRPVSGWKTDPFEPLEQGDKLIGLGSNDAGASVVALIHAFLELKSTPPPFNITLLLSAEEEISGKGGVESVLDQLPQIQFGIVGEPTSMKVAVAEKGLIVVDGVASGKSGHAARNEGDNAIYKALKDIELLKHLKFAKVSNLLGPVKVSVTQIEAGTQHNVVPGHCHFVIDVRTTDSYTNEEVMDILQNTTKSQLTPRSLRLNSSGLPSDHTAWPTIKELGLKTYGSPTLSDQALMSFPTVKMGPGESSRSHTAGEFIKKSEIEEGIKGYKRFLNHLRF